MAYIYMLHAVEHGPRDDDETHATLEDAVDRAIFMSYDYYAVAVNQVIVDDNEAEIVAVAHDGNVYWP